jgi:hypothetical protein
LLRQFDERLANAYGRERTDALLDDGGINRIRHPLDSGILGAGFD